MRDGMTIGRCELFKVFVIGKDHRWHGYFTERPCPQQIGEALYLDIAKLEGAAEHERDRAQKLRLLAEIIPHIPFELEGSILIADVEIGRITVETLDLFKDEQESMMPILPPQPPKPRIPGMWPTTEEPDLSNSGKVNSEHWRGVPAGTPSDELNLEQHVMTDPRTGEAYPLRKTFTPEQECAVGEQF